MNIEVMKWYISFINGKYSIFKRKSYNFSEMCIFCKVLYPIEKSVGIRDIQI